MKEFKFYINRPARILGTDKNIIALLTIAQLNCDHMNDAILKSAEIGSMFGWDCDGAKLAKEYALNKLAAKPEFEYLPTKSDGIIAIPYDDYQNKIKSLLSEGVPNNEVNGVADAHFLTEHYEKAVTN